MGAITVLLVDEEAGVRRAVRRLLETEADVSIVAEAADGGEAVHAASRWQPRVAIVDLTMPSLPGLAAIRQLRAVSPSTAILGFTMFRSETYVYEAMRAGAHGYLLKSAHEAELIGAVRAVSGGRSFLPVAMRTVVVRRASLDARRVNVVLGRMMREPV